MEIENKDKWLVVYFLYAVLVIAAFRWVLSYHRELWLLFVILALLAGFLLKFVQIMETKGRLNISLPGKGASGLNVEIGGEKENIAFYRISGTPMSEGSWTSFLRYLAEYLRFTLLVIPGNELVEEHVLFLDDKILDERDPDKRIKLARHANSLGERVMSGSTMVLSVELAKGQMSPEWAGLTIEPITSGQYAALWRGIP